MRLGGLVKCSLVDFPGLLAAVVFTQGCPWRCDFCHNPSLVVPELFNGSGPTEEAFFAFLDERRGKLDGVVVTGGEPTVHADLPVFLRAIRERGFALKLDTNGAYPERLGPILEEGLVDYVAMDLKAPLRAYAAVVRAEVAPETLRASIALIRDSGIAHEFRTTVLPGLHDTGALCELARLAAPDDYYFQRFEPTHTMNPHWRGKKPMSTTELSELALACARRTGTGIGVRA